MAKRMYDTGIIQQKWYMELEPRLKALWWQLHAMMDNAGVFEINEKLMEAYFGGTITRKDIFESFGSRIQQVPEHPDKGIFVDYVAWSNPKGLSNSSSSQRSVISRMNELGLTEKMLNAMSKKKVTVYDKTDSPNKGLSKADQIDETPEKPSTKRAKTVAANPPTVEEVRAYIVEMSKDKPWYSSIDPEDFVAKGESTGWIDKNGNKYTDWKAVVRTWASYRKSNGGVRNGNAARHSSVVTKKNDGGERIF